MKIPLHCPYCQQEASLVYGDKIYPHRPDLHEKRFYLCLPCAAYVGCHPGTYLPLGRLADAELREQKQAVHTEFDLLWQQEKWTRSEAYRWLSVSLNISPDNCHIGMFDVKTCQRALKMLKLRKELLL